MAKKKNKYRKPKRYGVIVQMQREQPYKWKFNELEQLQRFLDKNYPEYRYYDIYCNATKEFSHRVTNYNYSNREYKCIVKVSQDGFKTLHTDNLLDFVEYIDSKFYDWRYFNVFKTKTGVQKASFTKNKRPIFATI